MSKNLAALLSLAVVLSGAVALSTQSAEAKNSRKNTRIAGNYFVPPPPPYTPSLVPVALGMTYAPPAVGADGDYAVLEQSVNPYKVNSYQVNSYNRYILKRNQVDTPQVVQPNPYLSLDRGVETKVQKSIDDIDSEISNIQKEIGTLLNL